MTEWVIPCNPRFYDIESAFQNRTWIDWRQSAKNISPGDVVYIYVGTPVQEIKYKCLVKKAWIPASDADYTEEIYNLTSERKPCPQYMRLELLEKLDGITLAKLVDNGMKGNIQGPRRVDKAIEGCLGLD